MELSANPITARQKIQSLPIDIVFKYLLYNYNIFSVIKTNECVSKLYPEFDRFGKSERSATQNRPDYAKLDFHSS